MSIKITSDSTCDLSPELISRYQVEIVPLTIVKDGKPYRDGLEITPGDIFRHVDAGGDITSTTAVSVGEYRDVFARLSPVHDAVIHINISAEFSSCHQNACIAAEEFDNVYHKLRGELSSPTQQLIVHYCRERQIPPEVRRRKVYVVRALILGAAIQFENGELTYGEEALQMVHDCIQQALELA